MKDLQLTIYDLFSILLPAALVLTIFHLQPGLFHNDVIMHLDLKLFPATSNTSNAADVNFPSLSGYTVLFVVTYALGQVLHTLGKFVEDMPKLKLILTWNPLHIRYYFKPLDPKKHTTFFSNGVRVVYSKEIADLILTKLYENYHMVFSPQEDLTDALIQPLALSSPSSLTKRDTFLANACMMRNITIAAIGFAIYFALHLKSNPNAGQGLWLSLAAFVVFRYGYQKYKSYAERLLLSAFLAVESKMSVPASVEKKAVS